ncbi:MAG: hypothetical protein SFV15_09685 [Polyangiaceae bacterium]|nr:hypothetical protein [Polyangiaceae bacterium]
MTKSNVIPRVVPYALEQLFVDQDRDLVHDTIAAALAWIPGQGKAKRKQPFRFEVEHLAGPQRARVQLDLTWDMTALESAIPGLRDQVRRLQTGRSAQREHITELAAYALTLVAISVFLPGRRALAFRKGSAPDILLDPAPGALRGVETAGRSAGGKSALLLVRNGRPAKGGLPKVPGKASLLVGRADIAEVHLSLWSGSPRISIMEQVKP